MKTIALLTKDRVNLIRQSGIQPFRFPFILILFVLLAGCDHFPGIETLYEQKNLVADTSGYGDARIDPALKNAWGIAVNPKGILWVSANHSSASVIYDKDGNTLLNPVKIPSPGNPNEGGSPTGQVFNDTKGFLLPGTSDTSRFIFVGEDGIISAWAGGEVAKTVIDNSASEAVYKGVALGNVDTEPFLYVANFRGKKIEVYDKNFKADPSKAFEDTSIPSDFGPFNIQNINGKLYVTYAKLKLPDGEDDEPGDGNGYVNIFDTEGKLIRRWISQGKLNSPWGITKATYGFGQFSNAYLIGNFGDGLINAFDYSGRYLGTLKDKNHNNIQIDGLWALTFLPENVGAADEKNHLYFTAGPNDEVNGLFGFIKIATTDVKEYIY